MTRKILILGASYGSLLGTKLAMAGHDVALVCTARTANLINSEGTIVVDTTLLAASDPLLAMGIVSVNESPG